MSNEITRQDPAYGRLLAANRSHTTELVRFPMKLARETGLAPTYIIAKYDGGVGSSTLAAILGMFMNSPLFIEIGGNRSRAFKAINEADIVDTHHLTPIAFNVVLMRDYNKQAGPQ